MVQPKFAIDVHADANDFLTAPINISASGNNTVIVGVPGKLVRVYMIWFLVSAANTIIFNDGTTAFSGPADFTANEALVFDFCTKPWFVTSRGNDFAINLANAVQVGGMVYYTQDYWAVMGGFEPDREIVDVMVKAGYFNFNEMNPTQQAFARAQCGMMLYALEQAGYRVSKNRP